MEDLFLFNEIKLIIGSIIGLIIYICFLKSKKVTKTNARASLYIFIAYVVSLCFLYYLRNSFNTIHLFTTVCILFFISCLSILKVFKIYNEKIGTLFMFLTIFLISFSYIYYTPYYLRQHDLRNFEIGPNGGHLGYMAEIFYTNKLPEGNPIDKWCFFNPPLHYIISSFVLKLSTIFTAEDFINFEVLQIMSYIYFIIFIIYTYKILKKINIKKLLLPATLFIGLAPALIIMSGSINNDMLAITLSTIAIYYTIVWYESDKLKDLIKIALTISLAIMTKVSSALIAIAIATVFLTKVIKNKKDFIKYVKHFSIFALIALPIGLWFPVKNYVLYDIPFTYVQSVDESNDANISYHSTFERYFTFNKTHLDSVNIDMSKENAEYNIYLSTIKSFIVDENIDYSDKPILHFAFDFMLYLLVFITLLYLVNIIYLIVTIKKDNNNWLFFFLVLGILQIISYINFCFGFPFTFTMNFRYIIPTLLTFVVILSIASEKNEYLHAINKLMIVVYSIISIIIFTNVL